MFEITISLPATGAPGGFIAGVDGISAMDDCLGGGGDVVEGDG
jgi:hypothetical protein